MPISQILPDGNVRIYNSKTGEVKDVAPNDLASYSPRLVGEYQELLAESEAGVSGTSEVATNLRKEFRDETKDLDFKELRSSYDKINAARETAAGDLSLIFSYMKLLDPGSVVREGEQATAESARGVPESIRNIYNKTVRGEKLTDEQRSDFKSQAASLYNTYVDRQQDVTDFYSGLAQEAGIEPEKVIGAAGEIEKIDLPEEESTPEEQDKGLAARALGALGGAKDFLFSGTENLLQDVIQTPGAGAQTEANQNLLDQAAQLSELAEQEQDPQRKQEMLQQAQNIFDSVSGTQSDIAGGFSEDIEKGVPERALQTGLELSTAAEIPALAKGASKLITKAPGAISKSTSGLTVKGTGATRKAVAQATKEKIPLKAVKKAVNEYAKIDPTAENIAKKVATGLDKSVDAQTALKKLEVFNKAYSAAGRVGKSGKAGVYDVASKALRNELETVAPELYRAHRSLGGALGRQKFFSSVLNPASLAKTAIGTAIGVGVGRSL